MDINQIKIYKEIEKLFENFLKKFLMSSQIDTNSKNKIDVFVFEFLEHDEFELALDTLSGIILNNKIKLNMSEFSELVKIGEKIEYDLILLDALSPKNQFPTNWADDKIDSISFDIASDPLLKPFHYKNFWNENRYIIEGIKEGLKIKVIKDDNDILISYPIGK